MTSAVNIAAAAAALAPSLPGSIHVDSLDTKIIQYSLNVLKLERLLEVIAQLAPRELSPANRLAFLQYLTLLTGSSFNLNETFISHLSRLSDWDFSSLPSPLLKITGSPNTVAVSYDDRDFSIRALKAVPKPSEGATGLRVLEKLIRDLLAVYIRRLTAATAERGAYRQSPVLELASFRDIIVPAEIDCALDLVMSLSATTDPAATLCDMDLRALSAINAAVATVTLTYEKEVVQLGTLKTTRLLQVFPQRKYAVHRIAAFAFRVNDLYILLRRAARRAYVSHYAHLHDPKFLHYATDKAAFGLLLKECDEQFNNARKNGVLIATITRLIRTGANFPVRPDIVVDLMVRVSQGWALVKKTLSLSQRLVTLWTSAEYRYREQTENGGASQRGDTGVPSGLVGMLDDRGRDLQNLQPLDLPAIQESETERVRAQWRLNEMEHRQEQRLQAELLREAASLKLAARGTDQNRTTVISPALSVELIGSTDTSISSTVEEQLLVTSPAVVPKVAVPVFSAPESYAPTGGRVRSNSTPAVPGPNIAIGAAANAFKVNREKVAHASNAPPSSGGISSRRPSVTKDALAPKGPASAGSLSVPPGPSFGRPPERRSSTSSPLASATERLRLHIQLSAREGAMKRVEIPKYGFIRSSPSSLSGQRLAVPAASLPLLTLPLGTERTGLSPSVSPSPRNRSETSLLRGSSEDLSSPTRVLKLDQVKEDVVSPSRSGSLSSQSSINSLRVPATSGMPGSSRSVSPNPFASADVPPKVAAPVGPARTRSNSAPVMPKAVSGRGNASPAPRSGLSVVRTRSRSNLATTTGSAPMVLGGCASDALTLVLTKKVRFSGVPAYDPLEDKPTPKHGLRSFVYQSSPFNVQSNRVVTNGYQGFQAQNAPKPAGRVSMMGSGEGLGVPQQTGALFTKPVASGKMARFRSKLL